MERRTYTAIPTMLLGMAHGAAELIVVVVVAALVTAAYTHTETKSAHRILLSRFCSLNDDAALQQAFAGRRASTVCTARRPLISPLQPHHHFSLSATTSPFPVLYHRSHFSHPADIIPSTHVSSSLFPLLFLSSMPSLPHPSSPFPSHHLPPVPSMIASKFTWNGKSPHPSLPPKTIAQTTHPKKIKNQAH